MKVVQSATFRLTLSYLAVIMVLSIGFSALLYQVSSAELIRGLRRPLPQAAFGLGGAVQELREQQLTEGLGHLQENIILLNCMTLLVGAGVSYALARWTLRPVEETVEAQGRFAADASHELRTPLTAMQTEIEVALRDPRLTAAESRLLLKSNLEEIAKLRALSDGLLKLTQSDRADLRTETVDLSSVSEAAIRRFEKTAQVAKIVLISDLSSVSVKGDKASLVELVAILLDNAIKYSPSGTKVTVSLSSEGKQASLMVHDQGQGIKPRDLPHIFERFYRADQSRSKSSISGYGLGLSIADRIVRLHGGTIQAKSHPGKGTTFTVLLPLG